MSDPGTGDGAATPPSPAPSPARRSTKGKKQVHQPHLRTRDKVLRQDEAEIVARNARGHYRHPRDQYIYSEEELSDSVLSKIWKVTRHRITLQRTRDRKSGLDWVAMREAHFRNITMQVSKIVEKQYAEDQTNAANGYRSVAAYVNAGLLSKKVDARLKQLLDQDIGEYFKALKLMAGTAKVCVEIEDRLTGAKVAQQIFDSQMQDYDWFVEVIKAFVRDPNSLENIAKAIQARRVTRTLIATGQYADQIAYTRNPQQDFQRVNQLATMVQTRLEGPSDDFALAEDAQDPSPALSGEEEESQSDEEVFEEEDDFEVGSDT